MAAARGVRHGRVLGTVAAEGPVRLQGLLGTRQAREHSRHHPVYRRDSSAGEEPDPTPEVTNGRKQGQGGGEGRMKESGSREEGRE